MVTNFDIALDYGVADLRTWNMLLHGSLKTGLNFDLQNPDTEAGLDAF